MNRRCSAATLTAGCLLACSAHAGAILCPQAGQVLEEIKISQTSGGFGGQLGAFDSFGCSVAALGDLDGEEPGVMVLAVGANTDDDGGTDRGCVWLLTLDANGDVLSEQKISHLNFAGLDDADYFGTSVVSVGDLDGDQITDLAVGAPGDDDGGANRGAVWILFLNANGAVKDRQKISDLEGDFGGVLDNEDSFGISVGSLGASSGPGVAKIAIGAHQDGDGGPSRGAVWVLSLDADGTVASEQKISDTDGQFTGVLDNFDYFGLRVAGLGDLDNDGVSDLAVGAHQDDDGGTDRGAVWILFLNSSGQVVDHQKISDLDGGFAGMLDNSDVFGTSLAAIDDLEGDGITELAVGAYGDDDGGAERGAVWILSLNSNGAVLETRKISDLSGGFGGVLDNSDLFGCSVAWLGDLDVNGTPEVVVGAQGDDDGDTGAGAIWVLSLDNCVDNSIQFLDQPDPVTLLPEGGGVVQLSLSAIGAGALTYQWRKDLEPLSDGGSISGSQTETLTVTATNSDIGVYDCVVSDGLEQDVSDSAVLAIRQTCLGDLNGDGDIDFGDLNALLGVFSSVCP